MDSSSYLFGTLDGTRTPGRRAWISRQRPWILLSTS